jgi:crotonobetainyl-CoA:carnitine CoA-transferase CaiB-like acyl-CoA transferase
MIGPLEGIRIVSVERALAGPYASMIMGDLGAEVIKVEPPGGEQVRSAHSPPYFKGEPSNFLWVNRNKKSLILDMTTETGLTAFYDLVKISDVVLDNNRPGVMERLKTDYDTLKGVNPRIICCSITGFGPDGPYAKFPSYDLIGEGMAGILLQTGEPNGPPIKPAPSLADMSSAYYAVMGIMAALLHRSRTGEGQKVNINLLDSAITLLAAQFMIYILSGEVPERMGAGHLMSVPFGAYKTKDGWITIGVSWPQVTKTLGIEWTVTDPRFATIENRIKNRKELENLVTQALSQYDTKTWLEKMRADDIPVGPVYSLDEVLEDPQVKHNKMVLSLEHSLGGQLKMIGTPFKMPTVNTAEYTAPPTVGQHNHEVLSKLLGYSESQIKALENEQEANRSNLQSRLRRSS